MHRREHPDRRWPGWAYVAGLAPLALFGVQAFVRGNRVPLLGWIDLALHEFGHVATFFLPRVANAIMGNGTQTLVPLVLAAVFVLRERDWLGTALCLGWAGTTLQDASVYIADAPYQRLQLIGGYHDWAYALAELGRLHQAEAIARTVWTAGLLVWVVAVLACATGPWADPVLRRDGLRGVLVGRPSRRMPPPRRSLPGSGPRPGGQTPASWEP